MRALLLAAGFLVSVSAMAQTPQSITEVFDSSVSGPERACLAVAKAMPANKYSFIPVRGEFKGVRSFAQLTKHIAVENYRSGAALLGEKIPVDTGEHDNGPDSIKTKEEVIKFLRESFSYFHKAVSTTSDKNLMEIVSYGGNARVARLQVLTAAISHPWDIYGQMVEYVRMNGIDPQK